MTTPTTTLKSISAAISRRKPLTPTTTPKHGRKPVHHKENGGFTDCLSRGVEGNEADTSSLKRTLGVTDVIFYGIGCSVGAGIYSLVGIGAKTAGPAISLSFALCGIACCFTSLAYAEFAARVPLAGSAYTFTYVSFGELAGWLVGWNLTLGYAISAAAVARSWAVYVSGFFHGWLQGYIVRESVSVAIATAADNFLQWFVNLPISNAFGEQEYQCCPLAAVVILLCTSLLVTGAKESARFNTVMTILNISVLGFVVIVGWTTGNVKIQENLLTPSFFPEGFDGVGRAAGLVFFSYLGFDMVSCLSEEVRNPEKNMPIGIVGSLVASTIIYCVVSLTVVGMVPIKLLGDDVPVVNALLANACCTHNEQLQDIAIHSDTDYECLSYPSCKGSSFIFALLFNGSRLISFAAIFGLTTATFACLMGQPRIFFSMAQDGLLFKIYGRVNPETGVPTAGTIITGITTAFVACFVDLESLANTISLGTLQVFTFVNAGVIVLRMTPSLIQIEIDTKNDDEESDAGQGSNKKTEADAGWNLSSENTAQNERSYLIPCKTNGRERTNNICSSSCTATCCAERRSSLLPDEGGAVLVREASREFRSSLRSISSSIVDNGESFESQHLLVELNGSKPYWLTLIFTVSAVLFSASMSHSWRIGTRLVLVTIMLLSVATLWQLPQSNSPETFSCPCVPAVPLLGIFFNSYMMGSMPSSTWSTIILWLLVGGCFYFCYGMHHSELRKNTNVLGI
ncbi:unnamed protein product [Pseudo-nitzschia multistriata]|uniref:Cationic amino acid transporter C-terminal domain-containing protein n=1 Tax=Pseudo-nitzschia multistriata TaxID=183589 RepID=A0A448YWA6_9STRA|nr:unnamed protein product [Pseudo-nitzschia multistriata]